MDKRVLLQKLRRIDEDAFFACAAPIIEKATVVIVGGSALLLCDLSAKATTKDVDIYQMKAEDTIRKAVYSDPDFNAQCQAHMQNMPYCFEDRLVPVPLATKAIDYYTPAAEDLAVMKLYRWEDPDKADLTAPAFLKNLDWDLLHQLVYGKNEAEASRSALPENDRGLKEMRRNYEEYRKEWKR